MDFNAIANQAVADLQSSINALNAQRGQPGANTQSIDQQITALENKQVQVRATALGQIEASPQNQAAITAATNAAASLTTQAKQLTQVANALTQVGQVLAAATSLLTALAAFA